MATLTAEQIGKLVWNAGARDEPTIARAVAIALAESGGRTDAHNTKPPDDSYGLWQINMTAAAGGPARRKQFGLTSDAQLLDPATNAKAMWAISNQGKNWSAWTTFTKGRYLTHMPAASSAARSVMAQGIAGGIAAGPGAVANAVGGIASGLDIGGAITAAANTFSQTLFKAGLSAGAVLLAVVLAVLGVVILLRAPLEKAAKTAVGAAPVAKVVKP